MPVKEFKSSLIMLGMAILIVLGVGALVFSYLEGWSLIDSFYFVSMTASTVGYGDFTPTSPASKIVTVIYALSIIPLVLYLFTLVAQAETSHVYKKLHAIERKQEEHAASLQEAQKKLDRQHQAIKQQEKEIESEETKLKRQAKELDVHEKEIGIEEKELEIVEDVVANALTCKK